MPNEVKKKIPAQASTICFMAFGVTVSAFILPSTSGFQQEKMCQCLRFGHYFGKCLLLSETLPVLRNNNFS